MSKKNEVLTRLIKGRKATNKNSFDRWAEDLEIGPLAARLKIHLFIYEPEVPETKQFGSNLETKAIKRCIYIIRRRYTSMHLSS